KALRKFVTEINATAIKIGIRLHVDVQKELYTRAQNLSGTKQNEIVYNLLSHVANNLAIEIMLVTL
ncbi:MAG: hypothetical protein V1763_03225, partial [Parcubacteria group bacterium]